MRKTTIPAWTLILALGLWNSAFADDASLGRTVDGLLDYAPGWPKIEGISGELLFEGAGMRIKANRGRIFGAELKDVTAVLPDFESDDVLTVRGTASGPTQDFLRFIAESPVAASINHFTDPFRVEGSGSLDLHLVLPLAKIETSRVKGEYQFAHNALRVAPSLPAFTEAAGRVAFTESQLVVKNGSARVFGDRMAAIGQSLAARLRLAMKQHGIPLWLDAPMVELITGADGEVDGVAFRQGGQEYAARRVE